MTQSITVQELPSVAHDCQLVSELQGRTRIIKVVGPLDWATAGGLHDLLQNGSPNGALIIDMLGTTHVDSAGTGSLLAAFVRARRRGQQLVIVSVDPLVLEVLHSAGLDSVTPIVDSEAEALHWLGDDGAAAEIEASVLRRSANTAGSMKAAVVREFGAPLVVEDRPVPRPGPGDVLVRVEACGLCHTDIHAAHADWPVKPLLPFVPGHGAVGQIAEVGPQVSHVRAGDRVAIPWLGWACGRCEYCLSGAETLCRQRRNTGYDIDGGFAEYAIAYADFVVKVPDGVDPLDAACLSCAGVSAYKAVKSSGARSGNLTAVFGIGGLGHLVVQYAKIAGATVVAVDRVEDKLTMANNLGASYTVDATVTDPVRVIQDLGGAHQAIVAAGSTGAADQALASLRPGGTLVLMAMPADNTLRLPLFETVQNSITILGSIAGSRLDLTEAFSLHARGYTRVVHQARVLAQVNEAIAEVEADKVPARLVFEFR